MNGTKITRIDSIDISQAELTLTESPRCPAGLMHPDTVVSDLRLTQAEKREILASWASDVRAVPDAPALRQLDNGAIVRINDVLLALRFLNEGDTFEQPLPDPFRAFAGLRIRLPTQLKLPLQRSWPDDDDPPPCPATIVRPFGDPLSGGETADLGLALAA